MSDPKPLPSWRFKLARAEEHLQELETQLGRYASRHPYEARRTHEGDVDERNWKFVLHFTEQPGPLVAIVLGDVLTNLRASLDHLASALAPQRRKVYFPLVADIGKFNLNPTPQEHLRYEEARKSFDRAVRGMPPKAIARIEALQPYNLPPFSADGTRPQIHMLLELARLVNADKHKRLVPIAYGLAHARSFAVHNSQLMDAGWYSDFHDDGAVVGDVTFHAPGRIPDESEVKVHIHGTPRISVKIVEGYGGSDVLKLIQQAMRFLVADLFPDLEGFV